MRLHSRDRRPGKWACLCFCTDLDCIFGKTRGECDIIVVSADVLFPFCIYGLASLFASFLFLDSPLHALVYFPSRPKHLSSFYHVATKYEELPSYLVCLDWSRMYIIRLCSYSSRSTSSEADAKFSCVLRSKHMPVSGSSIASDR